MSSPYPFDMVVPLEEMQPWHDCDLMISGFRVEIEVHSSEWWSLQSVTYRRPTDGDWVRPAMCSELEKVLHRAALGREGYAAIEAAIASKLEDLRSGAMQPAYRMAAE